MFVNPKITVTPAVDDPATAVRKARVLLDHQLREDAAYNRPVSRVNYRLGGASCQITHEFGATYIHIAQHAEPPAAPVHNPTGPNFLNILLANRTQQGFEYLTAWQSLNGSGWVQRPVSAALAAALQFGKFTLTQVSGQYAIIVGQLSQFSGLSRASWALVDLDNLTMGTPQLLPPLNGQPVLGNGQGVFVGNNTFCFAAEILNNLFFAWFNYVTGEYVYTIPYYELFSFTSAAEGTYGPYLTYSTLVALTRSTSQQYAPVAIAAAVPDGLLASENQSVVGVWVGDANTSTSRYVGGLPNSFTAPIQTVLGVAGADGTLGLSYPSANTSNPGTQAGTNFWLMSPLKNGNFTVINFEATGSGLYYSPIGWSATFLQAPSDFYFFSGTQVLGMVARPAGGSPVFINPVVAPTGVYDVMGGGVYRSATQGTAFSTGLPIYSNPESPLYVFNNPDVLSTAFYLGSQIAPWLNLY